MPNPYGWILISCDEPTREQWRAEAVVQREAKEKAIALVEMLAEFCAGVDESDIVLARGKYVYARARLAEIRGDS